MKKAPRNKFSVPRCLGGPVISDGRSRVAGYWLTLRFQPRRLMIAVGRRRLQTHVRRHENSWSRVSFLKLPVFRSGLERLDAITPTHKVPSDPTRGRSGSSPWLSGATRAPVYYLECRAGHGSDVR